MIINLSSPLFTVHLITLRVLNLFQLRTAALLLFYYIFYQPVDPVKHNPLPLIPIYANGGHLWT